MDRRLKETAPSGATASDWLRRRQAGAGYVEYAVLAGVGVLIVATGVTGLGQALVDVFGRIAQGVAGIGG